MNANVCEISLGDDKNVLKLIVVIVVQICMLSCFSRVRLFMTPWPDRLLCPWDFPGKNTEMGCHALLQGSNPSLPHCRWILYHLSHKRKPKNPGVGSLSLLQRIFQKIERGSPALQVDSLPTELSGKPTHRNLQEILAE